MSKEVKERLFSLQEFNQHKFDHVIPIYELDVERTIIAYWRREGLLPFIMKGKWAKVSFVEAIWIMMLESLRKFGVPMEMMKKLTWYFIERAYRDDLATKNLQYLKSQLERKKIAGTIDQSELLQLQEITERLKDEFLLQAFKWDINYFSNLITESVLFKYEAAILIFQDGTIVEQVYGGYQSYPKKEIDFNSPHMKISLFHYLKVFIEVDELNTFLLLSKMYTDDEERVLREIRNKNISELTIQFSDGKIRRVESTKSGTITGEQQRQIKEILGLKNYERITFDTRDDKTLSFRRTKKKI